MVRDASRWWAKTSPEGRWHGLPYHLLDVLATSEALWGRLSESSRRAARMEGAVATFLAAAHDVGKGNPYFQAKDERRARALGLPYPTKEPESHGYFSAVYLRRWLMDRWGWEQPAAANVAKAVGGHHGAFWGDLKESGLELSLEWWASATNTLDGLARLLNLPAKVNSPSELNSCLGWLAGFVSVADWLGSHSEMTVWETRERIWSEYLDEARQRAAHLLDAIDWPIAESSEPRLLSELVPEGRCPNALQEAAAKIARAEFGLAIVEAPTGEGKTEAAFALAERSRSRGEGLCFLLPTMATANGLYPRVARYIGGDPRLAHSQAWLYRHDRQIVANPEDDEAPAEAEDWFAGSKRALLTQYGVGTIDQALMAALRVRHGFVRLFALAGKTVVIDEVHAYDVYMSDLLDILLGWLRALGCQVVLLSATLPARRRAELVAAWGAATPPEGRYLCITWVGEDLLSRQEGFAISPRKPLQIRFCEPEEGLERILQLVRQGAGLGALILNTVHAAQDAYAHLKDLAAAEGIDLMLFHARYAAEDRAKREVEVLSRFGKDASRNRPAILVATQVVEQSLDLDFDHMVTALAPIDLLIQRAGRLHRHRRDPFGQLQTGDERDQRPDPVLQVIPPDYDDVDLPEIREPMYDEAVLRRTEALIREGLTLVESADFALAVETIYGESTLEDPRPEFSRRLEAAVDKQGRRLQRMHDLASEVTIPAATSRRPLTRYEPRVIEDDAPGSQIAAKTRLEDMPSITLVLLRAGDLEPGRIPTAEEKRKLALRCVRVAAVGKRYDELLRLEKGAGWKRVKSLREARPMTLEGDEIGVAMTESYVYRYDAEIGLRWEARDA